LKYKNGKEICKKIEKFEKMIFNNLNLQKKEIWKKIQKYKIFYF